MSRSSLGWGSDKGGPQGKTGRKALRLKIEVECAEHGCSRKLYVNRGNATRQVRCEYHRRIHRIRTQNERNRRNYVPSIIGYDPKVDSRLAQLASFTTYVKCRNDFCDVTVETNGVAARNPKGVYCEDCRAEAKRIQDRNYYANRGKRLRQKKREEMRSQKETNQGNQIAA